MTDAATEETFDSILERWERLLPRSAASAVFSSHWWHKTWWDNFGGDRQPRILSVGESGGGLLGIAPLMSDGSALAFLGDRELTDYLDFIVLEGAAERFYPALWRRVAEMDWTEMILPSLPAGSPALSHLPPLAESAGMKVTVETTETTPKADLPATWDEFLAGLRKKDRHELRRKLRRLDREAEHRQYDAAETGDSLADSMGDFFRLLRASRDDKRAFMTPERERFFMDIAREASARGVFSLQFLEVDGVRVAGCICFDGGGDCLLYNSGYDPAYSKLSVGLLNKALALRSAIEEGRAVFNFLKGNERYKYNLGGRDEPVYDMAIAR